MNIYKMEMKQSIKSLIGWVLVYIALFAMYIAFYSSIENDLAGFEQLLKSYPEGVLLALGGSKTSLLSFLGYYSFAFLYIAYGGALQGTIAGMSVIGKESAKKTSDFLLTKPIKRWEVLTQKYLSVLTGLLITNAILIPFAFFLAKNVDANLEVGVFLKITFSLLWTQLIFSGIGFLVGSISKKMKGSISISIGIATFFLAVCMVVNTLKSEGLKYLSPLNYFEGMEIIQRGTYTGSYVVCGILLGLGTLLIGLGYYMRKNIPAA